MNYRKEIDGLRSIAIVPVVLFHAGFSLFNGGYLGVDIFFVISGYLITTIILNDIEKGRFSIANFYKRRFKRLLPAYLVLIAFCAIFSWFTMLPADLKVFSESVFASSTFISNIFFFLKIDYFNTVVETYPLIHTWSLSVEEQFYIIFPILTLIIYKYFQKRTVIIFFILTLVSLVLAGCGWRVWPEANFYLLPFRAWELGVGAISAIYLRKSGQKESNVLSSLGLASVVFSLALFDDSTPNPSFYTLFPVLGTTAVIVYSSSETFVGKILCFKPFVVLGLISYSTYLWHQPLYAFLRILRITSPSTSELFIAAIMSFVIGYLSWKYIENPFRKEWFYIKRNKTLFASAIISLTIFSAIGLIGYINNGFPGRLPLEVSLLASYEDDKSPLENLEKCAFYKNRKLGKHPISECSDYLINDRADVVFIGDSHSGAIAYPVQQALLEKEISSYNVTYSGCVGLRGFYRVDEPSYSKECSQYNDSMIEYARNIGAKVLVITSRFPLYLYGTRFNNGEGKIEPGGLIHYDRIGIENTSSDIFSDERKERMLDGFIYEINKLTEKFNVVLLDPIPETGWEVPKVAAKMAWLKRYSEFPLSTNSLFYEKRAEEIITAFNKIESDKLFRVHPQDILCNSVVPNRCINATTTESFYFDNNHLSNAGAILIRPDILNAIQNALKSTHDRDSVEISYLKIKNYP